MRLKCVSSFAWSRHDLSNDLFLCASRNKMFSPWLVSTSQSIWIVQMERYTVFSLVAIPHNFMELKKSLAHTLYQNQVAGKGLISKHMKPVIPSLRVTALLCFCKEWRKPWSYIIPCCHVRVLCSHSIALLWYCASKSYVVSKGCNTWVLWRGSSVRIWSLITYVALPLSRNSSALPFYLNFRKFYQIQELNFIDPSRIGLHSNMPERELIKNEKATRTDFKKLRMLIFIN
jgi:hypothetical protein